MEIGTVDMKDEATALQAAENDLKQLMTDVTRAMERAHDAVARVTKPPATTAETDATPPQ
jgi:hypothetical protein